MACRMFELSGCETSVKLLPKEFPSLHGVGPQTCMTFSVDGSRFASGGVVSNNLASNYLLIAVPV